MTKTETNTETVPTWWVADEYAEGFGFEPDHALGTAVAAVLTCEASSFDAELAAARQLAAADEASPLSRPKRAELAAAVQVPWASREGYVRRMSGSTYSKRVRAGRATDEQVLEFLMACDVSPSLDKLYAWLPKAEHLAKPKGSGRRAAKAETDVSDVETAEPTEPAPITDADVPKLAADALAAWRTRGLTRVQVSLLIAELDRLTTPVASVKAAA